MGNRTMLQTGRPSRASRIIEFADTFLEQRIDKRRQRRTLRQDDQQAQKHQHNDDGREPVFFPHPQKAPEFGEDSHLSHSSHVSRCGVMKEARGRLLYDSAAPLIPSGKKRAYQACNYGFHRTYRHRLRLCVAPSPTKLCKTCWRLLGVWETKTLPHVHPPILPHQETSVQS